MQTNSRYASSEWRSNRQEQRILQRPHAFLASNCRRPSLRLDTFRWRGLEFSTKHPVPEAASDTEPIIKVSEMMLKVVLLELLIVRWKATEFRLVLGQYSMAGFELLTCGDGGSNGSCHSRCIRKHRHSMPAQQHTNCSKRLNVPTSRTAWLE